MRTPPWTMLASGFDESAADRLIERWLSEDPSLPAVNGEPPTARAIARAWSRRTGRPTRCSLQEAMHQLSFVDDPPRPARGALRVANEEDRTLLVGWERAFVQEAGTGVAEEAPRTVAARLARGAQHVWDDGGPVSTLVLSPAVAGSVRIGPVYTPPERRCRGYATSAVAAAARSALASGALRCVLFTDLANPTSNRIYATVGFRRLGNGRSTVSADRIHATTPADSESPRGKDRQALGALRNSTRYGSSINSSPSQCTGDRNRSF